ncbi:MAG: PfkB family carbohydrate kinase, partial [Holophagales bacterium]|nr:PfkB family carbohydrate kinase [Holophagales bacterium]
MPEQLPDPAYSKDTEHVPKGVFVGLCTLDLVHLVPRLPGADEKLTPLDQWIVAGGPASNAAVTFAHLGGHPLLATALGQYPPSKLARSELESWGVEVVNLAPEAPFRGEDPYRLPLVTVMVRQGTGQRAILSRGAWGLRLGPGSFDPTWLDAADVLLVDGHLLEAAIAAAELAREQGVPV